MWDACGVRPEIASRLMLTTWRTGATDGMMSKKLLPVQAIEKL